MHVLTFVAFFAAVLFLPWFVVVPLGIALIAYYHAYLSVIIGGILLDSLFGAPIGVFSGFSFLYTALFAFLSAGAYVLRRSMLG